MAREGTRITGARSADDRRQVDREHRKGEDRRRSGRVDRDEWLQKKKEELKFQKESLERAIEMDISDESATRQEGNVTVRPGPRRPRGKRR